MIAPLKKPGRNDKCKCGSGKKHKKCCHPDAVKAREEAVNIFFDTAMRKALYLIVKMKGSINFTNEQLNSVPDDFQKDFQMELFEKGIVYSIKKEGIIEVPEKRIII